MDTRKYGLVISCKHHPRNEGVRKAMGCPTCNFIYYLRHTTTGTLDLTITKLKIKTKKRKSA